METALRLYQIARDGKVIGVYTLEELVICIDGGRIVPGDHYLIEGMQEWRLVSTLGMALDEARNDLKDKERKERAQARLAQNLHREFAATWMASLRPPQGPGSMETGMPGAFDAPRPGAQHYPHPSGLKRGIIYILCSGLAGLLVFLAGSALSASLAANNAGKAIAVIAFVASFLTTVVLIAVGAANLNAYSIEKALQRFDSYRKR